METESTAEAAPEMRCHLLRIPPELRLRIYDYYFGETKPCTVYAWPDVDIEWKHDSKDQADARGSQLLFTCKTISHEARPVLLASTELMLPSGFASGHPETIYSVQRKLDREVQCDFLADITKVTIHLLLEYDDCKEGGCFDTALKAVNYAKNVKDLTYKVAMGCEKEKPEVLMDRLR